MKKINEYFDDQAELHDELFLHKLGLSEVYDAVEDELNKCTKKDKILVLGCGSGLEIERIKFPSNVVAVDISAKMLDVLKQKKLYKELHLTTICSSFFYLELDDNEFDIVLSCYAMHHFDSKQKHNLYQRIYRLLKTKGVFINCDTIVANMEEEQYYHQFAEKIYDEENLPFASLHIDAPFCWEHEKDVLVTSGFAEINIVKEWTNTKIYKCIK